MTQDKEKNTRGRPSKFHRVRYKIIQAIREGNYFIPACKAAGVEYATFRNWMKKGEEEKEGEFFDFFEQVLRAEAEAESEIVLMWKSHIPNNWQAARDFLARRYPERWANHEKRDIRSDADDRNVVIYISDNGRNPK